jgi:NAD(P)-dependent dehydrogenase (short-subunit alcohol dehydrogenase family)
MTKDNDVQMPVVLITGAGIGIGRSSAVAFARAGYRVILTDVLEPEGRRGDRRGWRSGRVPSSRRAGFSAEDTLVAL